MARPAPDSEWDALDCNQYVDFTSHSFLHRKERRREKELQRLRARAAGVHLSLHAGHTPLSPVLNSRRYPSVFRLCQCLHDTE